MINGSGEVALPQHVRVRRYRRYGPHRIRMAFRRWRRSRPFWGGFWAILGGFIIAYGPATAYKLLLVAGTTVWVGILVGVLICIFGLFLWFAPTQRHLMGVLIVVLAVVSLLTSDFGGFLIGMVFASIGGSMGFAWVPVAPKVKKRRRWRRRPVAEPVIETTGFAVALQGEVEAGEVTGTPVETPGETTLSPEEAAVGEATAPEVTRAAEAPLGKRATIETVGEEVDRMRTAEAAVPEGSSDATNPPPSRRRFRGRRP